MLSLTLLFLHFGVFTFRTVHCRHIKPIYMETPLASSKTIVPFCLFCILFVTFEAVLSKYGNYNSFKFKQQIDLMKKPAILERV